MSYSPQRRTESDTSDLKEYTHTHRELRSHVSQPKNQNLK